MINSFTNEFPFHSPSAVMMPLNHSLCCSCSRSLCLVVVVTSVVVIMIPVTQRSNTPVLLSSAIANYFSGSASRREITNWPPSADTTQTIPACSLLTPLSRARQCGRCCCLVQHALYKIASAAEFAENCTQQTGVGCVQPKLYQQQ